MQKIIHKKYFTGILPVKYYFSLNSAIFKFAVYTRQIVSGYIFAMRDAI
jgi:hypothetical protein